MSEETEDVVLTTEDAGLLNTAPETTTEAVVEKFPELRLMFDALRAQKEKLLVETAPIREKRELLLASIQPVEDEIRALGNELKTYNPRLAELDNQISALARAMGGRRMSDGEPQPVEEGGAE